MILLYGNTQCCLIYFFLTGMVQSNLFFFVYIFCFKFSLGTSMLVLLTVSSDCGLFSASEITLILSCSDFIFVSIRGFFVRSCR